MEGKTNVAKVTVIGLGVSGLGALKNLLEEGFDAVGLERSEYLGGQYRLGHSDNRQELYYIAGSF